MPAVRTARNRKPPPEGFEDIEDTLLEFSNKMRDAENASHEGKRRNEVLWPIFQITHQSKYKKKERKEKKRARLFFEKMKAHVCFLLVYLF
jgi:bud site selection protein 31